MGDSMRVLETERLVLRRFTLDDAAFILRLVNEPAWLRYIGDKHVHDLEAARNYIRTGPLHMYEHQGFGMYVVELKEGGVAVGSCGLLKRDILPEPDIGYAFLPEYWGRGYALEAASAVLRHGHREHRLPRILAITSPDNERSIKVLRSCGMHFKRMIEMAEQDAVKLFALEFEG
jgi:RimJ/RimL family protein N-acetyltransferase